VPAAADLLKQVRAGDKFKEKVEVAAGLPRRIERHNARMRVNGRLGDRGGVIVREP
jgi:hypothetical protein